MSAHYNQDRSHLTRIRLARRIDKAQRDNTLIIMLAGGDKSSQVDDISRAVELAATIED